jgi:hypothetical protein
MKEAYKQLIDDKSHKTNSEKCDKSLRRGKFNKTEDFKLNYSSRGEELLMKRRYSE